MTEDNNTSDNVTPLSNQNQNKQIKDPKKAALAKIAEGATKEWNQKIEAQVKKTVDAIKIAATEKKALADLIEDSEEAREEYAGLVREI